MNRSLKAMVVAGFIGAAPFALSAGPAAAQGYPSAGLPPSEVLTLLRSTQFTPMEQPRRRGNLYIVRALDREGRTVRVVVDAQLGEIVAVRAVRGPAVAEPPGRTYSRRWSTEPDDYPPYAALPPDDGELPPPGIDAPMRVRPGPPPPEADLDRDMTALPPVGPEDDDTALPPTTPPALNITPHANVTPTQPAHPAKPPVPRVRPKTATIAPADKTPEPPKAKQPDAKAPVVGTPNKTPAEPKVPVANAPAAGTPDAQSPDAKEPESKATKVNPADAQKMRVIDFSKKAKKTPADAKKQAQTDMPAAKIDPKTDPKIDPKTDPKADPKTDPKASPEGFPPAAPLN